jgi:phosphoribosylanthranilate isomerase
MWIKICGTTNLEDAQLAVEAGADALGFVFAPSPRRISPKDARKITQALPATVEKIGVFVNQSPRIVMDTVETAGLSGVQLQAEENSDYVDRLLKVAEQSGRTIDVFKGISLAEGVDEVDDELEPLAGRIRAVICDSGSKAKRGGTGNPFDWAASRLLIKRLARSFNVVIAGGLNANNVVEAIELFHPWGVDVVTGVEQELGKKDATKVREFIAAARHAALATTDKGL